MLFSLVGGPVTQAMPWRGMVPLTVMERIGATDIARRITNKHLREHMMGLW